MGVPIDLGLDRAPPVLVGQPVLPRWWLPRRSPCVRRTVLSALVVLGVLGVFTPAAPAGPSPLVVVAERTVSGEEFFIFGDLLFISESPRLAAGDPVWSAHKLPTGDYLWTTPDRPAMLSGPNGPTWTVRHHAPGTTQWTARDPQTGAELWSTTEPTTVVPGTGVGLLREDLQLERGSSDQIAHTWHLRLSVVEQVSGVNLWSVESADGWRAVAGTDRVVLVDRHGRAEVRDLLTGDVRVTRHVPDLVPAMLLSVRDGAVLVVNLRSMEPELTAYDVDTLEPVWHRAGWPSDALGALEVGGNVDYFSWHTDSETGVLDTMTGQVLTIPEPRTGQPLLVKDSVVFTHGPERLPREVVDRSTGEVVADLTGWSFARPTAVWPQRLVLTRQVAGGTMLASLDGASGQVTHLGVEPRRLADCQSFSGGLVCRHGGRIVLWRWR
jgi:hypothetical protein